MIDHVSIAVRDLARAARFYQPLLGALGMIKLREWPDAAIGYGNKYPEFWINKRAAMVSVVADSGVHICFRAPSTEAVDTFHAVALAAGGASDGAPGLRAQYHENYYSAFIRDPDGNRIEAVTFVAK
jgi:catechol 2,3-dioxygenase-like lactoylglutathione lyase family enzyme